MTWLGVLNEREPIGWIWARWHWPLTGRMHFRSPFLFAIRHYPKLEIVFRAVDEATPRLRPISDKLDGIARRK